MQGQARLIQGDCIAGMRALEAESVHCCVTSPPYFGLRDYGCEGQIGLEATPDEFVAKLVEVFAEVWRILRDDGTLWLNLGDSYSGVNSKGEQINSPMQMTNRGGKSGRGSRSVGLKPKDLIGVPWRVAFALQADGWYLRSDIIWHKPNPMPESVTDRPTKAHEYLFLLSKQARYYYDAEAIKEQGSQGPHVRQRASNFKKAGAQGEFGKHLNGSPEIHCDGTRNKRSVWTVTPKPYKGAHFATMPPDLVEPCILAGCPVGGLVLDPFTGSGTTGAVAVAHGRRFVGCELNPEYITLAEERIRAAIPTPTLFDTSEAG